MEKKPCIGLMGINVYMINSPRVEGTRPPDYPMHLVTFREQKFRKVGTVLASHASNKRFFQFLQDSFFNIGLNVIFQGNVNFLNNY